MAEAEACKLPVVDMVATVSAATLVREDDVPRAANEETMVIDKQSLQPSSSI